MKKIRKTLIMSNLYGVQFFCDLSLSLVRETLRRFDIIPSLASSLLQDPNTADYGGKVNIIWIASLIFVVWLLV